jgi:hypothetical protein
MPVPTIFLIDGRGEIVEMNDQPYDSELLLQELLAKYPTVLAGEQMNSSAPVTWLLVTREAAIRAKQMVRGAGHSITSSSTKAEYQRASKL